MKGRLVYFANGLMWIAISYVACRLLAAVDLKVVAAFLAIIVGITGPAVMAYDKPEGNFSIILIFAIIFSGIIPALTSHYYGFGNTERNIRVSELSEFGGTTLFEFRGAQVEGDYVGHCSVFGRRYKAGDVYVAPIVDTGWTKAKTIYAWAVSDLEDPQEWRETCSSGIQKLDDEDTRTAIKRAVKEYGLKSDENAMLLEWCCQPSREWKANLLGGLIVPVLMSIIWLPVALITYKKPGEQEQLK